MIATTAVEVRNLQPGETLPSELQKGFPAEWQFDPYWTWVVVVDDKIVGFMLGAPVHGVVLFVAVTVLQGHGRMILRLLRACIRDCQSRGFRGWLTYLNRDKKEQMKLLSVAQRTRGAVVFPYQVVCLGGRLDAAARW